MKSTATEIIPILGTSMGGGFYAGRARINGEIFALIVAPKISELKGAWNGSLKSIPGATSYCDGMANTMAMAEGGSELAQAARELRIGDADDWYIPAQDELEIIYRSLKPTTETNSLYGRSGVNASAVVATYAYSREVPAQTFAEAFMAGGAEAFADEWYLSSTQHADYSDCAWGQYFDYGNQYGGHKSGQGRARAVRRLPI